jgi:hypothetical protein
MADLSVSGEPARQHIWMVLLPAAGFMSGLLMVRLVGVPFGPILVGIASSFALARFLAQTQYYSGRPGLANGCDDCRSIGFVLCRFLGPVPAAVFGERWAGARASSRLPDRLVRAPEVVSVLAWRQRGIGGRAMLGRALLGPLSEGALAIAAWALAWYVLRAMRLTGASGAQDWLDYGSADLVYSLGLVWPTGIAFVIALSVFRRMELTR